MSNITIEQKKFLKLLTGEEFVEIELFYVDSDTGIQIQSSYQGEIENCLSYINHQYYFMKYDIFDNAGEDYNINYYTIVKNIVNLTNVIDINLIKFSFESFNFELDMSVKK